MNGRTRLVVAVVGALLSVYVTSSPADADGKRKVKADLDGYQETPLTLSTPGSGEFKARINKDETEIEYVLTYRDLPSPVQQAHIHFGRPATTGQVVLFLCTNLAAPAGVPLPPACPASPGTVEGTLTAADVIARPTQGIDAGATGFAEVIAGIRAGATYANVHTVDFPSGEIRGAIPGHDDD